MEAFPELYLPAGTTVAEHDIVVPGPALLGPTANLGLGVRAHAAVVGHGSRLSNPVETEGDVLVGRGVHVDGAVVAGGDAGLAPSVIVAGSVTVGGVLTIAETATVGGAFAAGTGTVVGRPLEAVLLKGAFARHILAGGPLQPPPPLVVPPSSKITDERWTVQTPATVAQDCRIHGNITATSLTVGAETELFGGIRTDGDVTLGSATVVHGDVRADGGHVTVADGARVRGTITGRTVQVGPTAVVDGRIRATEDVTFES